MAKHAQYCAICTKIEMLDNMYCLLSLTPPEAKQRLAIAPQNTWYDRPDPAP